MPNQNFFLPALRVLGRTLMWPVGPFTKIFWPFKCHKLGRTVVIYGSFSRSLSTTKYLMYLLFFCCFACGGLRPLAEAFFALLSKKELIMLFWPIFCNFWCPVVTLVTFRRNLSNFERNLKKKSKKFQQIQKYLKKQFKKSK